MIQFMLPRFRYHPDPIATKSVEQSTVVCKCCNKSRGFIYNASVYSQVSLRDSLCPWCIADGSAAAKFQAIFSDDQPLAVAGVPEDTIEEITTRTPGFVSWQQEVWLCCCKDACEFHGDASLEELRSLAGGHLVNALAEWRCTEQQWRQLLTRYAPGGNPAIYKFVCRHCGVKRYSLDFA